MNHDAQLTRNPLETAELPRLSEVSPFTRSGRATYLNPEKGIICAIAAMHTLR